MAVYDEYLKQTRQLLREGKTPTEVVFSALGWIRARLEASRYTVDHPLARQSRIAAFLAGSTQRPTP